MERLMKSQPMHDSKAVEYMKGKKIMEINPKHPLIKTLREEIELNEMSKKAKVISELLYESTKQDCSPLDSRSTLRRPMHRKSTP